MHVFMVPRISGAAQQNKILGKAITRIPLGQIEQRCHQGHVITRRRLIRKDCPAQPQGRTCLPNAQPVFFMDKQRKCAFLVRPQSFFSITFFKARFPKLKAAYICLRRAFSYSKSRMRFTSEAPIPQTYFSTRNTLHCLCQFTANIFGCAASLNFF